MASNYPGGLDAFATSRDDNTPNEDTQAEDHNNHADAINKIEAELGVNPSGVSATVAARLDALSAGSGSLPTGWIDAEAAYGVVADGTTDNLAALNAATAAAAAGSGTRVGSKILLPVGSIGVSDQWLIEDDYIFIEGANESATEIKALGTFPTTVGKAVVQVGPDTGNGDIFGVKLCHLRVNCNSRASVGIGWNDANEHCAQIDTEVRNFVLKGTYVTQSNALLIQQYGAEGISSATGAGYPIHLDTNAGSVWLHDISNVTSGRTANLTGAVGVRIDSTPMTVILGIHAEWVQYGIGFYTGSGSGVVIGAHGNPNITGQMLYIDAGYGAPSAISSMGIDEG